MQEGPVVPVPAREVLALGAVGSIPSGWGIVEGGEIPYLPEARVRRDENRENYLDRDPEVKCYLPGVPRANYMPFPFQIFQSESAFFMAYEYAGAVRDVYLQDPGPPEVDSWMGQSVGRWEDDTFVVTVSGFNGETWFDRAGNHHSWQMTVEERYTMISPYHILYEATVEDTLTFSEPWTIRLPLYRHVATCLVGPGGEPLEGLGALREAAGVSGSGEAHGSDAPFHLAYYNLPRKLETVGIVRADWTAEELEEADERAREVLRPLLRGELVTFDPARLARTRVSDDMAPLLGVGILAPPDGDGEEEASDG